MPPTPIIPFEDLPRAPIMGEAEINRINPQRFEMAQLTAITLLDIEGGVVVAYKDVRDDEFWVRGHMPDFPLLPGVMMLEAAAQAGSFLIAQHPVFHGDFVGLGGVDKARFRGSVRPGDRLWLVGKAKKFSSRIMTFDFQGFVEGKLVFEVELIGVPIITEPSADSSRS